MTGHRTGAAQAKGKASGATLTADLTQTGKAIGGSLTAVAAEETLECTMTGRLAAKPVLHAACIDGSKLTLRARLDTSAGPLKGTSLARHLKHHGGSFELTKAS